MKKIGIKRQKRTFTLPKYLSSSLCVFQGRFHVFSIFTKKISVLVFLIPLFSRARATSAKFGNSWLARNQRWLTNINDVTAALDCAWKLSMINLQTFCWKVTATHFLADQLTPSLQYNKTNQVRLEVDFWWFI